MRPYALLLMVLLLLLLFPGCVYEHTVRPLTLDMDHTPVVAREGSTSVKLVTFPRVVNSYQLVAWDSAAIGDIVKKKGLKEIYFTDLETLSIFRIWNQYTVHVYGR